MEDHSGMRLFLTSQLRPHDAGIMELGLIYGDSTAIPPGQAEFPLTGYCVAECTERVLPDGGITVFGSQLHTHGSGIRVATKHVRNGIELPELNRDNHYSTHFQEIRSLHEPTRVFPVSTVCKRVGGIFNAHYQSKLESHNSSIWLI